ncbi:MAG: O-antigen ligase family protein [Acidobacteriota bacterium]
MREHAPAYLAGAAAATSTVSIAASQIFLGLAIVALLLDRRKLRWPPVTVPLIGLMVWTLVSLAASPDPRGGLPQIKKFYVYLMMWAVFSGLRTLRDVRTVAWGWVLGGSLSALWALVQFERMYTAKPDKFYSGLFYYVYSNDARITGFMGHWMTFSAITMMALCVAGALLLFAPRSRAKPAIAVGAVVLLVGLIAGWQRSVWAGAAVGAMWLLWSKRPVLVLLVPVFGAVLLAWNPAHIRDRVMLLVRPQPNLLDSSAHRAALRATGWEMIKAHPWVGVGPEQAKVRFYDYAPPAVPHPVPHEWSTQHLHNLYYHYAAERGLPALAALLWLLGRAFTISSDSVIRWGPAGGC